MVLSNKKLRIVPGEMKQVTSSELSSSLRDCSESQNLATFAFLKNINFHFFEKTSSESDKEQHTGGRETIYAGTHTRHFALCHVSPAELGPCDANLVAAVKPLISWMT